MKFKCYLTLEKRFNILHLLSLSSGKTVKCRESNQNYRFRSWVQVFSAILGVPCFIASFFVFTSIWGAGGYILAILFTPLIWVFSLMFLPLLAETE